MREKYILNPLSKKILHIGMAVSVLAYFFVLLNVYFTVNSGVILQSYVYSMIEHVSMTLFLFVAAALVLDIHIKLEK
ncbi:MAG: hypothetical protein IKU19_02820 [Clostridia bacterium]|nr:hypothetical protein [Clostridia bacterium]